MAREAASRWPARRRLTPVTCSPPLFQWLVHVRDHFFFPDVRTDIDVMEEYREVARHIAAPSQPFPVKIRGGLVVMTRTDVACTRTAVFQCDFATSAGKTCDRWLCPRCRAPQGPNRDYCPDHARQLALGLEPGANRETVRNTTAPAPAASSSPAAAAAVENDGKLPRK